MASARAVDSASVRSSAFLRHLHAASAAARRRLDQDGIADLLRRTRGFRVGSHRAVGAGHGRNARLLHRLLGGDLVAHQADMLGLRPDEGDAVLLDDLGEARVLRQKAVAGMDRFGAGDLAGRDDRGNVEIGLRGRRRADAHALIGQPHMHRIGVGGGMDRDGRDAHLLAGAVDAKRDLAAIGDEDFFEHQEMTSSVWPNSTGCGIAHADFADRAAARREDRVHGLHRFDDEQRVAFLHLARL